MRAIPITFTNVFFICMILLFACLFAFLSKYSKTEFQKKVFLILAFTVLVLFATFRGNVGTDTLQYHNTFDRGSLNELQREFGYYLIVSLSRILGDFKFELFFFSALSHYFVYKIIASNAKQIDVFTSFFAYICLFYFGSFNIMRQFLAICIFIYAIDAVLKDKKIKRYIITIIFASLFHLTVVFAGLIGGIIILYQYDKSHFIFNKKFLALFMVVFIVFFRPIIGVISSIDMFSKYSGYLSDELAYSVNLTVVRTFITVIWIIVLRYILKDKKEIYLLFFILETGTQFLGIYSIYIKRIALYFSQYQMLTYAYYSRELARKNYRVFRVATYVYLIMQLWITISSGSGGVFVGIL